MSGIAENILWRFWLKKFHCKIVCHVKERRVFDVLYACGIEENVF
jgi:hypothetical protein